MSIDDILKWHAAGLLPADIARLRKIGHTNLMEILQYKKWGLTVDDLEHAFKIGMKPKEYAKLRKNGQDPARIEADRKTSQQSEQFRALSVNECEMAKLVEAGVSPEEYEKSMALGLTYEEVLHASQQGIDADELARQKNELGMTTVDSVDCHRIGMPPEEYMALKELGLDSQEVECLKNLGLGAETIAALRKLGYHKEDDWKDYSRMLVTNPDLTPERYHEYRTGVIELVKNDAPIEESGKLRGSQEENKGPRGSDIANQNNDRVSSNPQENIDKFDDSTTRSSTGKLDENKQDDDKPTQNDTKDAAGKRSDSVRGSKNEQRDEAKRTSSQRNIDKSKGDDDDCSIASDLQSELSPERANKQKGSPDEVVAGASTKSLSKKKTGSKTVSSKTALKKTASEQNSHLPADSLGPKQDVVVIKSGASTPASIRRLLDTAFDMADRVLILDAKLKHDCAAFRTSCERPCELPLSSDFIDRNYFLVEGSECCSIDTIRRLVVDSCPEGMLQPFGSNMDALVAYIVDRMRKSKTKPTATSKKSQTPATQTKPAVSYGAPYAPVATETQPGQKASQRTAVQYARTLLMEQLNDINAKFDELMRDYNALKVYAKPA